MCHESPPCGEVGYKGRLTAFVTGGVWHLYQTLFVQCIGAVSALACDSCNISLETGCRVLLARETQVLFGVLLLMPLFAFLRFGWAHVITAPWWLIVAAAVLRLCFCVAPKAVFPSFSQQCTPVVLLQQ